VTSLSTKLDICNLLQVKDKNRISVSDTNNTNINIKKYIYSKKQSSLRDFLKKRLKIPKGQR